MKPNIKRTNQGWSCSNKWAETTGKTPDEAYFLWKRLININEHDLKWISRQSLFKPMINWCFSRKHESL